MDSLFNMAVILTAVDHFSGTMQRVASSMTAFDRMAERGHAWSRVGQQITVAGALTQGAATVMQRGLMSVLQPAQDVEDALAMVATGFLGTLTGRAIVLKLPEEAFATGFKIVLTLLALRMLWLAADGLWV